MEEIRRECGCGLGLQELAPAHVGVPFRCGRDRQGPQHPADGGRADPVAELEQLALYPLVTPRGVLGGEPLDQPGDPRADRRSAGPVRIRPFPGDQTPVPAQHGTGRDEAVHSQPRRENPNQRGEDGTVRPVHPGPRLGPSQHRDLVPQDEQLDILGRCRSAEQDQPAADPDEYQVEQTDGHGRPSCRAELPASYQVKRVADF